MISPESAEPVSPEAGQGEGGKWYNSCKSIKRYSHLQGGLGRISKIRSHCFDDED